MPSENWVNIGSSSGEHSASLVFSALELKGTPVEMLRMIVVAAAVNTRTHTLKPMSHSCRQRDPRIQDCTKRRRWPSASSGVAGSLRKTFVRPSYRTSAKPMALERETDLHGGRKRWGASFSSAPTRAGSARQIRWRELHWFRQLAVSALVIIVFAGQHSYLIFFWDIGTLIHQADRLTKAC